MAELIQEQAKSDGDETAFKERCKAIAAKIEALDMERIKVAGRSKMEEIDEFMDKTDCILVEYDDKLVRQLIENIDVVNARKVEVVFKSGITVEEMLPEY